jgi:GNAT superfamily N-acetyltransferase
MAGSITVYDCQTQSNETAALAETVQSDQFDPRVQPWTEGCESKYPRYHFVLKDGKDILGWMLVDIRTHESRSGRKWTYVQLDKVSARKGTKGIGKELGEYLKVWARARNLDYIWLWAINEQVSTVYETSWDYQRVQYYDGYGFMFYTIHRAPPLSMLQSILPDDPRKFWVAADMIAKMKPRDEELIKLIVEKRRQVSVEPVKDVLEGLMDQLNDIPPDEIPSLRTQLKAAILNPPSGGRMKTARNTHRLRFLRKHHMTVRGYSLGELAKASKVSRPILQQVYDRGIGAYKTNPTSVRMKGTFRKGVNAPYSKKLSKEQWAMARVYSFLDGNPKHDTDLRRKTRRHHK